VLTDHNASVQPVEQQSIALSGTATQATPQITWRTPAAITYGTALSGTQLDASATANGNKVPGKFTYKPAAGTIPKAGKPTLGVSFAPADATDYTTATATVTLQVNQATPQITWRAPAAITYGTALSGTQLDATATANGSKVQGTFTYTPAPGTIPTAGKPKLSVSFAPADSIDYAGATDTAYLTVNKAAPQSVLKSSAATITSGSSVKLTATLSAVGKGVAPTGTVAFLNGTKTLGTAKLAQGEATLTVDTLPVGTDSIKASYEGDGNYDTATSKAVSITVKSK
jgi:hypothetical protein